MSIKVIKTPDIHLTQSEINRYREQYRRNFSMYAGTPPDFEEWVIEQERQKMDKRNDTKGGI